MGKESFTPEQEAAIKARDNQVLVAAAAGSGKTSVLVERILTLVTKENFNIDQLLVVTFTEAAAAEMKERISEGLTKRLEATSGDEHEHLLRQSSLMPAASISTIHAFCRRLVKDYFHYIDIDPNFRVGDQTELELLQGQVMEALFEDEYQNNSEIFAPLVEAFGGGKIKDSRLDTLVRDLFECIESSPYPERAVDKYIENAKDISTWIPLVMEEISLSLKAALNAVRRAQNICRLPNGPLQYLIALDDDESLIVSLQSTLESSPSWDKLYTAFFSVKHTTIYTYRGKAKEEIDDDLREQAKSLRDKGVKAQIDKIRKRFFFVEPDKMREDTSNLCPIVSALFNLALKYREAYSIEKRNRNLVDFNDLEHFAIQILWKADSEPSSAALTLSRKYREVLIDEYQDTNEIQEIILMAISNARRFMVGDIKQSIYGFRRAQPQLFDMKSVNPNVNTIYLSRNFRSSLSVIDTVNFFFSQLMRKTGGTGASAGVEYDINARLYPGTEAQRKGDFIAELHVAQFAEKAEEDEDKKEGEDKKGDRKETDDISTAKIQQEARLIANRIHELDGEYKRSDIVILVRAVSSIAAALTEELKMRDINAVAEVPGGFFKAPEIMVALSLLRVVDNPRQDIDLLAVLRLYNFTPDELLRLRITGEGVNYYDFIYSALREDRIDSDLRYRLQTFIDDLNRWRKQAIVSPISRLIGVLYSDTQLIEQMGAMPGGAVRQANLRLLMEKAIQYEKTSFTGLFHFVRYMEWLQNHGVDESVANLVPGDDSLVRVMTIHKSKGLEFPVVFVSMLGRNFNLSDERQSVILHPEWGMGAMYTDLELRTRSNTLGRVALSALKRRETMVEELRVLYVAMTRAKEKLILTGCVTELEDSQKKWKETQAAMTATDNASDMIMPFYVLREAKCYLDWLMPCAWNENAPVEIHIYENILVPASTFSQEIVKFPKYERISEQDKLYFDSAESNLPSKIAISELKRVYALESSPDSVALSEELSPFEPPAFFAALTAGNQITPIRMGTVLHTVVEHMDINQDCDRPSIKKLIENLATRGLLSPEEAEAVNIKKLIGFAQSKLAARMRMAKSFYREVPFVIGISSEEVYGAEAPAATILVHGIIDCYFETEAGEIVLVDFKNDARHDMLSTRYGTQMKIYRKALEQATGKPVTESLFYSFALGDTYAV